MKNVISRHLASLEEFEVEEELETTSEVVESEETETKDEILEFTDTAAEVLEEHQEVENLDANGNPESPQPDVLEVAPDTSGEELPEPEVPVEEEVELDNPPEEETDDTEVPAVGDDDEVEVSLDDDQVDTDESIETSTTADTSGSDDDLGEANLEEGELDIPDPEETSEAEVAEAEGEADEAEEEAEEEDEEIEELEEDMEDLEEEKASVESYLAVLRHGVKTGVYSTQVVALTQERMLGLSKRLHGHVKVASMEDFNASNLKDYYVQNITSLEAVETKLTTILSNMGKDLSDLFTNGSRYKGYKKRAEAINKESDRLLGLTKGEGTCKNKQRVLSVPAKDLQRSIAAELATMGKFIPLLVKTGVKNADELVDAYTKSLQSFKEEDIDKAMTVPGKMKALQIPVVYKEPSKLDGFKLEWHDRPEDKDELLKIVKSLTPVGGYNKTTATGEDLTLKESEIKALLTLAKAFAALVDKVTGDFSDKLVSLNKTVERVSDVMNRKALDEMPSLRGGTDKYRLFMLLGSCPIEQYKATRNLFDVLVKRNFALAEAINSLVKQTVK